MPVRCSLVDSRHLVVITEWERSINRTIYSGLYVHRLGTQSIFQFPHEDIISEKQSNRLMESS
jgi:hypothetical protein